ncbi:TnsA endonuclease N-terminal domain-containing protein [Clostridium butyricum]|uniref:TnsA endonuclease N-terminal domain-containing protein n=1 Tax=Clostridium butyricum TaxID=1492 RepID=UPI00374E5A21
MAKTSAEWNEDKFKRYMNEGRGQGEGSNYKPWKYISDFSSLGRSSRINGWKSNRVYHLFSDIESRFFYLMEWEDQVIDIRESFPLLDLEEVIQEKDNLRLDLFKDKESGIPYVLTTSFLITLKENGKYRYVARSVKSASEMDKKIAIEKFQIEKRYWNKKGIDWGIVTQKEIPLIKAKNIEWVHSALYSLGDRGF